MPCFGVVSNDMVLGQAGVDTAFLYGFLDEKLCMEQPEGFDEESGLCNHPLGTSKESPQIPENHH